MKAYQKRTPGLFKVETIKDKAIDLCSKMYCCSDMDEKNIKLRCKGIQKEGNNVNYKKLKMFYLVINKIQHIIKVLEWLMEQ